MSVDISAAAAFVTGHGRVLDRRRLERLLEPTTGPTAVLAALDGYRNPDGGYGWGLEPDLRAPESQPCGAMHALEVLAEVGPATSPRAVELCDWLAGISLPDGGLPFALPVADPAGCAPWWLGPSTGTSSLQTTAQVAANAHRVARHDPVVAGHRWLAGATAWCCGAIEAIDEAPSAFELLFAVRFLDAVIGVEPAAGPLLERLGRFIAEDGVYPVAGGAAGEALRPLDFAPDPAGAARRLFGDAVIGAEVQRLVRGQQPDGGWAVAFPSSSPAAALEWRAYATVEAMARIEAYGALAR